MTEKKSANRRLILISAKQENNNNTRDKRKQRLRVQDRFHRFTRMQRRSRVKPAADSTARSDGRALVLARILARFNSQQGGARGTHHLLMMSRLLADARHVSDRLVHERGNETAARTVPTVDDSRRDHCKRERRKTLTHNSLDSRRQHYTNRRGNE